MLNHGPALVQQSRGWRIDPAENSRQTHALVKLAYMPRTPVHLWNLYETGLVPVSISYGGMGKYPPPATVERPTLIRIKVTCAARQADCTLQRIPHTLGLNTSQGATHVDALDVILLAVGLGFFALSIAYVYACERL